MHRNRKAKDALHRDKNHASSIELSKFEKKSHKVDDHEKLYIILGSRDVAKRWIYLALTNLTQDNHI